LDLYSKTISDNRHKTPTTVTRTPNHRVHPINNSSDPIDLLFVPCQLRITAHLPTVLHIIKTATNPPHQTLSATTVADLVTICRTASTHHATQLQIVTHLLLAHLQTMKTMLPATNKEPILSPILETTHRHSITIKPFVFHPLTQEMTFLTQSLGQTLHSLK
jgi:hypothetical protein